MTDEMRKAIRLSAESDPRWKATLRNAATGGLIFWKTDGTLIPEDYLAPWSRSKLLKPFVLSELNPPFTPEPEAIINHLLTGRLTLEAGVI